MIDLPALLAPLREPIRLAIPAGFALAGLIGLRAWKLESAGAGRIARGLQWLLRIFTLGSALWFALELTAGLFHWQTPASLAVPAFLGAVGIVAARRAREIERPVSPWPHRLRIALLLLVTVFIAEPAHTWLQDLRTERRVIVLFDDSASMQTPPAPGAPTPLAAAVAAVRGTPGTPSAFLEQLDRTHTSVLRRFALDSSSVAPADLPALGALTAGTNDVRRMGSDIAAALDAVTKNTPGGQIKGVVLFSDGRHTGGGSVEDAARRLGAQGVPVFTVPPPDAGARPDASLVRVRHPDSIFESDRARFSVLVQATAMRGRTLHVVLRQGGRIADERRLPVADDRFQQEVVLADTPTDKGILDYDVSVTADGDDAHPENNARPLRMAVSDDRYQVLLVDRVPRWEFRYLRNLFHARDKSVQLQAVLLEPDTITGRTPQDVEASPRRPFGESEATRLPAKPEDWKPFDVVILGDVPPAALTAEQWETLRDMVAKQGALLVVIAGPEHMPADYRGHPLADLLPVELKEAPSRVASDTATDASFHMTLSRAGIKHPVMQLADDPAGSATIWGGVPSPHWRSRLGEPKPAAEVLLFARPELGDLAGAGGAASANALIERMRLRDQEERDNALVTWNAQGRGRVVLLNFDATWRLRYGTGDTHHHKFWGQVLRWGAGPRLRSGNDRLRLGTDQLVYAPGEPMRILARASADEKTLASLDGLRANVEAPGRAPAPLSLSRGEFHAGLFEQEFTAPLTGGVVRVVLDIPESLRGEDGATQITTEVLVSEGQRWIELTDLTTDHTRLATIARLSGGRVVPRESLSDIPMALTQADPRVREVRSRPIWNHPGVFALLLALLAAEWVLRRRASLP